MITIELGVSADKFTAHIETIGLALDTEMRRGLGRALSILHDAVAKYPPASEANTPPGPMVTRHWKRRDSTVMSRSAPAGRWYVRGTGTVTSGGKRYLTSEQLGRSWTVKVEGGAGEIVGILGTRVSYAPSVQDKARQAPFHARRGWVTVQDALRAQWPQMLKELEDALSRTVKGSQ